MAVLEVAGLSKTFRARLSGRVVEAVKNLHFSVDEGSVVAFVGPNGAGKTTTLLTMLGFLKPDSGRVTVFGEPAGSVEARRRTGFQSEIFYTYPFHTARRALSFYGRLSSVPPSELPRRVEATLERLGLSHAADRRVGTFSKGMMQRLGLAQALLHEPDLLLLDEPTTGLDPEGRRLVADIIAGEKAKGRTVFLSSHILTDVERSCDGVVMIRKGELVLTRALRSDESKTQEEGAALWDVVLAGGTQDALEKVSRADFGVTETRDGVTTFRCSVEQKNELLRQALELELDVVKIEKHSETLEELYMQHLGGFSDG